MPATLRTSLDARPLVSMPESLAGRAAITVAATGLLALSAHVTLPLGFTPVPLTLQTFAVIVLGMMLGPVTAFSAVALYLIEGASGLPVFSPHEPAGLAHLFGPNGGYLLSYPFAAVAAGWLARQTSIIRSTFVRGLAAGVASIAITFMFGATWLAALLHLNVATTWHMGIAPFLPGEAIKLIAAATFLRSFTTQR